MSDQTSNPLRLLIALPGMHQVNRGAEVAFESIASRLARRDDFDVTLVGAGPPNGAAYRWKQVRCIPRDRFERWPHMPFLRNEGAYEELTFLPGLLRSFKAPDVDVTLTCSYPYTNWALRMRRGPRHIFVTQNGDWPARDDRSEYRFFSCDGLVCINPEYYERNRCRWPSRLIPNGVDPTIFHPGEGDRRDLPVPVGARLAVMVSALIESKHVAEAVEAASHVDDLHLLVAGDGPERDRVEALGDERMRGRFHRVTMPREAMPNLYRCADVFLHMSRTEPFGIVYLEALATGLPVVAHDQPTTRWIVEDADGLVETSDPEAVAEGLRRALDRCSESHVMARRESIERRFTWDRIAEQYADFLWQVHRGEVAAA